MVTPAELAINDLVNVVCGRYAKVQPVKTLDPEEWYHRPHHKVITWGPDCELYADTIASEAESRGWKSKRLGPREVLVTVVL